MYKSKGCDPSVYPKEKNHVLKPSQIGVFLSWGSGHIYISGFVYKLRRGGTLNVLGERGFLFISQMYSHLEHGADTKVHDVKMTFKPQ